MNPKNRTLSILWEIGRSKKAMSISALSDKTVIPYNQIHGWIDKLEYKYGLIKTKKLSGKFNMRIVMLTPKGRKYLDKETRK